MNTEQDSRPKTPVSLRIVVIDVTCDPAQASEMSLLISQQIVSALQATVEKDQ